MIMRIISTPPFDKTIRIHINIEDCTHRLAFITFLTRWHYPSPQNKTQITPYGGTSSRNNPANARADIRNKNCNRDNAQKTALELHALFTPKQTNRQTADKPIASKGAYAVEKRRKFEYLFMLVLDLSHRRDMCREGLTTG